MLLHGLLEAFLQARRDRLVDLGPNTPPAPSQPPADGLVRSISLPDNVAGPLSSGAGHVADDGRSTGSLTSAGMRQEPIATSSSAAGGADTGWQPFRANVDYGALYEGSPALKDFTATLSTEGHRIYAYENDILYAFSIPAYYGNGFRTYLNMKYSLSGKVECWLKFANTHWTDRDIISSGYNQINGSNKTELKLQLRLKF